MSKEEAIQDADLVLVLVDHNEFKHSTSQNSTRQCVVR
ncbi:nucleotide sugar dehydrogenase domain protein [Exiguobacterium sp. S17]|nr:nucleotide sugar dehydrogenase domain protein [Exiguobacterium sp. S17]